MTRLRVDPRAKRQCVVVPPFTCKFCGAPSWVDPADQEPPADYCHESDHGTPEDYEND
jgi:hypothetical protein